MNTSSLATGIAVGSMNLNSITATRYINLGTDTHIPLIYALPLIIYAVAQLTVWIISSIGFFSELDRISGKQYILRMIPFYFLYEGYKIIKERWDK